MTANATPLFLDLAAAYVRGSKSVTLDQRLSQTPLAGLTHRELERIVAAGCGQGLRLHRFKRTMGLRRVERILGILRGLQPASLLDVGSGRGAFLWPLLDALRELPVISTDVLPHRLQGLHAVRHGGIDRLAVVGMDAARMPFGDKAFDGVTFLETLEHIPDPQAALAEAVRVARRFVVLSVPSKADDNPEHIHLFDEKALRALCLRAGAANANSEWVLNHMIAIVRVC